MKIASFNREALRRMALIALVAAAAAGVVKGREKPALEPAQPRGTPRAEAPAGDALDIARLLRAEAPLVQADPFAPRSFAPLPADGAGSARQAREPAPGARDIPPLPFAYFGRLTQNGRTEVYLVRGEELIGITPGQRIDRDYRVDSISATAIRFTYLPLQVPQSIELSSDG